jgi:hypothetical protein
VQGCGRRFDCLDFQIENESAEEGNIRVTWLKLGWCTSRITCSKEMAVDIEGRVKRRKVSDES